MKGLLNYVIWAIVIWTFFAIGMKIQLQLEKSYKETFDYLIPYMIFSMLFPIFMGMLLGLPNIVKELIRKRSISWKFHWQKMLTFGLPAFYLTVSPVLYYTAIGDYLPFAANLAQVSSSNLTTITGLLFGYILLDSLLEKRVKRV
ncbi:hypothetical protein [Bacillus suaedaesalsae]|uniref:Uncharacterized protein n=1 Tax=Bacillus suaedaesalsae TaxID=2810349 RepID=A0ABS2DKE7_9BACI|nr:hypothetical protein [Bacillus suaedaesalsae]MBM6617938.1 hypothetical protein [Bacillus suaedaesalsae]